MDKNKRLSKYIPTFIYESVFDIDYNMLISLGYKYILIDLDNTLIPYDEALPSDKLKELFKNVKEMGLSLVVISNNHKKRVKTFSDELALPYFYHTLKPFTFGLRRALKFVKNTENKKSENYVCDLRKLVITCGDQIMTDIIASNKLKLSSILVRPLKKKSEKWYTKFNRRFELRAIEKMEKYYNDKYIEIKEKHE